jgi:predicted nucleic acid-binding protein
VIYFDSSYLVRLYTRDHGWEAVRKLAQAADVACSAHGQAECVAAYHRKWRENTISQKDYEYVLEEFGDHCAQDAYHWLPLTDAIFGLVAKRYETLPTTMALRAADAMHLASAAANGFKEIYSNDVRLLAATKHFNLRGVNIL